MVVAVPDCLLPFLDVPQHSIVARVSDFADEQRPFDTLLQRTVFEPYPTIDRLTGMLSLQPVDWQVSPASLAYLATLNDELRYDFDNKDFYTEAKREFVSYSVLLRVDDSETQRWMCTATEHYSAHRYSTDIPATKGRVPRR
jgi:hypothetical protein